MISGSWIEPRGRLCTEPGLCLRVSLPPPLPAGAPLSPPENKNRKLKNKVVPRLSACESLQDTKKQTKGLSEASPRIYKRPSAHEKSLRILSHWGTQIPTARVPLPSADGEGRKTGDRQPQGGRGGALNLQPRCWGRLMRCVQNGRQVPAGHADLPPSPVGPPEHGPRRNGNTSPDPVQRWQAAAPLPTATPRKPQHASTAGRTECALRTEQSLSAGPAPGRMQPPAQGQGPQARDWGTEPGTCPQGDAQDGQTRGDRGHRGSLRAAGKREGVAGTRVSVGVSSG